MGFNHYHCNLAHVYVYQPLYGQKYCRNSVKHYIINQSIMYMYTDKHKFTYIKRNSKMSHTVLL